MGNEFLFDEKYVFEYINLIYVLKLYRIFCGKSVDMYWGFIFSLEIIDLNL